MSNGDLSEAQKLYRTLATGEYGLGIPALTSATNYTQGMFQQGGYDQSAKYQAMSSDVAEQSLRGGFTGDTSMGGMAGLVSGRGQASAIGQSSLAQQKILAGVDEINKVRSMLGSQGLKTTALGVEAAKTGVEALSMVPRGTTQSTVLAGLGAASSIYGAYSNAAAKKDATVAPSAFSTQSQAPVGSAQYYESGQSLNLQPSVYTGGYFGSPNG